MSEQFQVVDVVEAHLAGAPPICLALAEDRRFGLGRADENGVFHFSTRPLAIADAAAAARAIISGNPRAMTAPGALLATASALLIALYILSSEDPDEILPEPAPDAPAPASEGAAA